MGGIKRRKPRASSPDYEVGYGKPPIHSRFKPGHSGNSKGRPKGTRNFKTDVQATLKTPVRLTRDGKAQRVSTQKAALLRLREKALGGDARALEKLLVLSATYNNEEPLEASRLSDNDVELLELYTNRVLRGAAATQAPVGESSEPAGQTDAAMPKAKRVATSPKRKVKRRRMKEPEP